MQVVPFVRYPWKHKIEYLDREEILNRMQHPVVKVLEKRGVGENKIKEHEHFYRKNLANKKEFK